MDTARIQSRIGIKAPAERIWDLIVDLPGWGGWNPVETNVSGAIAYGGQIAFDEKVEGLPLRQAQMRVAEWEPLAQLVLAEKRGFMFGMLRFYEIEELEPGSCIFSTGYLFTGLRGEMFHDKHRPALRRAADAVAEAIQARVQADPA